jgi:uncharacterized Zn-finger protein
MSDHSICLFPTDPHYVPDPLAQESAVAILESGVREIVGPGWSVRVTAEVTEHVEVILPMENFGEIWCPVCGSELDLDWWSALMGEVCDTERRFDNVLSATPLPCCGAVRSLADLTYTPQPVGFARFQLEAHGIRGAFKEDKVALLERALGCGLRQTWIWR